MNNDLISREAMKKLFARVEWRDKADGEATICMIETAPTIDPVHAAGGCYCSECKFWDGYGRCEPPENGLIREYTRPNDFCSYGERREKNA